MSTSNEKLQYTIDIKDDGSAEIKRIGLQADKTDKKIKGLKKDAGGLKASFASIKQPALAAGAALAAVAAAAVVAGKSVVKAASEVETLNTQFKVILGSAKAAEKRIKSLADQAARTPFKLTQYANASRILQTLTKGALATETGLALVGDAAASTGEDLQNLSLHIGRMYDGLKSNRPVGESMARLQELGLVSGALRGKLEQLQKKGLGQEAWNLFETNLRRYKGGMEALSLTADGLASTLSDNWDRALRSVSDATGALDKWKGVLKDSIELLNTLEKYKAFDRASESLSKMFDWYTKLNPQVALLLKLTKSLGSIAVDTIKDADEALKHETDSAKKLLLVNESLAIKYKEQKALTDYLKNNPADTKAVQMQLDLLNGQIDKLNTIKGLEAERLQKQQVFEKDEPVKTEAKTGPSKAEEKARKERIKSLADIEDYFEKIRMLTLASNDKLSIALLTGVEKEKEIQRQKLESQLEVIRQHENAILTNKHASEETKQQAQIAANAAEIEAKLVHDQKILDIESESQRQRVEQENIARAAKVERQAKDDAEELRRIENNKNLAIQAGTDVFNSSVKFADSLLSYKKQALKQEEDALRAKGLSEKQIDDKMMKEKKKVANAEKAITITKIVIDTALGATRAYNAYQSIPGVGPALGAAAAAITVANGVAQAAIVASKKFAGGGVVSGSRSGDRQNVNLNGGEMILNEDHQFNALGGNTALTKAAQSDFLSALSRPNTNNNTTNSKVINFSLTVNGGGENVVDQIKEAINNGELEELANAF
jgi:hypothetical protein